MYDLHQFLESVDKAVISNDEGYFHNQIGKEIEVYEEELPSLEEVDIVIVGISERRGSGEEISDEENKAIRNALYKLYQWHKDIKIADLGNIKTGET